MSVAWMFNVPVAYANLVPLWLKPVGKEDLFIPKKLWHTGKKRFLTFRETIESKVESFQRSEHYSEADIELVENTSDEILALTKEMHQRLEGTWVMTEEDEELQRRFRAVYAPGHRSHRFPSRIGAEFIRQNRELLE